MLEMPMIAEAERRTARVSIIVPTIVPNPERLQPLLDSLSGLEVDGAEILIVNQSDTPLAPQLRNTSSARLVEHQPGTRLPAPAARNLGAALASGDYLLFLDDDAVVHSRPEALARLLAAAEAGAEVHIAQRGEIVDGAYVSHWPQGLQQITAKNFPLAVIEWNLLIKKSAFVQFGGFPEIGPGSPHAAQCGEAFVLAARMIGAKLAMALCPEVQIAHPRLFDTPKSAATVLGYAYGAGYAVGMGIRCFDLRTRLYWTARVLAAALADASFRRKAERILLIEAVDERRFKSASGRCRLTGFLDACFRRRPRPVAWLQGHLTPIT